MSLDLVVEQLRGGHFEASHPVSAVVADARGTVVEAVGAPLTTTWRSAAKPFQLEISLAHLPEPVQEALDARDLALGASSHSAEPEHVDRVLALLGTFGLTVDHLYCGAHEPIHLPSARALSREGREAGPVHNNCSGKHAFMAAAAHYQGWAKDYRDPTHPLQERIRARIAERAGVAPEAGVDGCGVPCWVLPLPAMARAWAQLAEAMAAGEATALGRIGWAMQRHPWHVSGTGRAEEVLVREARCPLVCKIGAEGLMCGALPDRGLGFALKVRSGNADARAVATFALLARLEPDLVPGAAAEPWTVVRNVVGRPVGTRVARWLRG